MSAPEMPDLARVQDFVNGVRDLTPRPAGHDARPALSGITDAWHAAGLRAGDLVLLALPNGALLLHHFFAVHLAGGVPALVPPHSPSVRLRELAAAMGARAIAGVRLPAALTAAPRIPLPGGVHAAVLPPDAPPAAAAGEIVVLTSGTSGFASGCVFDLAALLRNGSRHAASIGQRSADSLLVSLPLHFSFALVAQTLAALAVGSRLVIGGPPFHVPSYLEALRTEGITVSALTPLLARLLLRAAGAGLPGTLRVLSVGGDTLGPDDVRALLARRPGGELYLTYGLTQAGPRVSTLAAHREPAHRHSSVGLPLGGTRVALEAVPGDTPDATGQLLVASDTLMRRRIGAVEGRAGAEWRPGGFLATGDVFERDAAGDLYFRGRLGDFIVRGDEKICLAAVRRTAAQLPGVVAARTHRFAARGGQTDYELTLETVAAAGAHPPEALPELLRRRLRRGELPHTIHVVPHEAGGAAHK